MNTPPVLDQTSIRLWPSRSQQFIPLLYAGILIGGGIILGQVRPDSAERIMATAMIGIGIAGALPQIRLIVIYRPRYILDREGITIVNQRGKVIPWFDIESVDLFTTHVKDQTYLYYAILHLHDPSFISHPNRLNWRRLFSSADPSKITLSLDLLTISPTEALEQFQGYHRKYSPKKRK